MKRILFYQDDPELAIRSGCSYDVADRLAKVFIEENMAFCTASDWGAYAEWF